MREIDPKVDFIFKIIFGSEENKDILLSFINSILRFDGDNKIEKVQVLNPFVKRELLEDKTSMLEVKAKTAHGEVINIEMQIGNKYNMDKRSLHYWSKLYSVQLSDGYEYKSLMKTISINIINFDFIQGDDFHKVFHVREDKSGIILNNDLEIHFLELLKVSKPVEEETDLLKMWLQFLKFENKELLESYAMSEPAIKKAINILAYLNRDADTRDLYEIREKALKDEAYVINGAKEDAKQEGIKEGKKEDALKFLEMGLDEEMVSKGTGLSIDEVRSLKPNI